MRDLSLHILDLIENAMRAGASAITVTVAESPDRDTLNIIIEDNGPGLRDAPETVLDPFYTTKESKRTGLGLSLFQAAAERAGGQLTLGKSALGGLAVKATMRLNHLDRAPLGDLAATISSVVCTNPQIDLRCRFSMGERECELRVLDVAKELVADRRSGLAVARRVAERIREGLVAIEAVA